LYPHTNCDSDAFEKRFDLRWIKILADHEGFADVRFGSKADIATDQLNVRFTPKSGHRPAHSIISADGRLALDRA
jgi:hypothetical protein